MDLNFAKMIDKMKLCGSSTLWFVIIIFTNADLKSYEFLSMKMKYINNLKLFFFSFHVSSSYQKSLYTHPFSMQPLSNFFFTDWCVFFQQPLASTKSEVRYCAGVATSKWGIKNE